MTDKSPQGSTDHAVPSVASRYVKVTQTKDQIDIDFRGFVLMLGRQKKVILSCALIGLSLAAIALNFMPAQYTAKAVVLVDKAQSSGEHDTAFILGEVEVLKSRELAKEVVQDLNLMGDPEFNPRFEYEQSPAKVGKSFRTLSVYESETRTLPEEAMAHDVDAVTDTFLDGLAVQSLSGSKVIEIEYKATNAGMAAKAVNSVVDHYMEQSLEIKFGAAKAMTAWLDGRLADLSAKVQEAEARIAEYTHEHGLRAPTQKPSNSLADGVEAQAELEAAEARLSEGVRVSSVLLNLKRDLSAQEASLAELSARYGPKHPTLIKAKAEAQALRAKIRHEEGRSLKTLQDDVAAAEQRVEASKGDADIQEPPAGQQDSGNVAAYEVLLDEAQAARSVYEAFLKSYEQSSSQDDLQGVDARVLTRAAPPRSPSFPNKGLILSLAGLVSLILGLIVAVMIEVMNNTFRSANELEDALGYPCYALIPEMDDMTQKELTRYIVDKPSSTLAECVRSLRMVLNLRPPTRTGGEKPKCVVVTSSLPGEGKTTLSVWLARLAAKSGEKVILIDGDLRRPNAHRCFGESNDASIVDYLTGEKELEEIIHKDEMTGLHKIYARSVPNSALDLVGGDKMGALVRSLKEVYDLVIIDSPACLAVSDARVLANMGDQLVYVVSWDDTPREVVAGGVKQFRDVGYADVAFVLSNVDVKRHMKYGYGDSLHYYGENSEYTEN